MVGARSGYGVGSCELLERWGGRMRIEGDSRAAFLVLVMIACDFGSVPDDVMRH
jgi:hypothetical protein